MPEFKPEAMAPYLPTLDDLFLLFLFGDADHELGGFGQGDDLLEVKKKVIAVLKRGCLETLNGNVVVE